MFLQLKDEKEAKKDRVLFPIRSRVIRKNKSINNNKSKSNYLHKSIPTLFETCCGTSISCRIVSNFIKVSNINCRFERVSCSLANDNNKLLDECDRAVPDYMRMKVPSLKDGNLLLFELGAIIRYLDSKYSSVLFPKDYRLKAIVDQSFEHIISTIRISVSDIIQKNIFVPIFNPIEVNNNYNCRDIEIYLDYISNFYFRKNDGKPMWNIKNKRIVFRNKNNYESKNKIKNDKNNVLDSTPLWSDFAININPCFLSPALNIDDEKQKEEKIIGCGDSLDAAKAMTDLLKLRLKSKNSIKVDPVEIKEEPPKLYLVLERLTLADTTLFAIIEQLLFIDFDMKNKFPIIWKWFNQMKEIPVLNDNHKLLVNIIDNLKHISNTQKRCVKCTLSNYNW